MRTPSGTPRPASPAIATSTTVTSTDGPGWPMKMSDRIFPPGCRSSHHMGRSDLRLGRVGAGFGFRLVIATELVRRVGGGLGSLSCSGQRAESCRLLRSNLRCKQTIVDGVLEAMKPALLVRGRIFGGRRIAHVLTFG